MSDSKYNKIITINLKPIESGHSYEIEAFCNGRKIPLDNINKFDGEYAWVCTKSILKELKEKGYEGSYQFKHELNIQDIAEGMLAQGLSKIVEDYKAVSTEE